MGATITGGGNTSIRSSVDRGSTPAPSSPSGSPSTSPPIRPMTEEERKANMLISSDVDRAGGVDRTKEAIQKQNNEQAKAEFEANNGNIPAMPGASIMPGSLPDTKSMYPEGDFRNHLNPDNSLVGTIRQKVGDANEKVSSYIPSYNEVIAKRDQFEQSNPEFGNKMQVIRDTAHKNERVGSAVDKFATFGKGIYEEVDENPVGVAITTAAWVPGGAALKIGSTAGKMALLRAASLGGTGSKIGRGLTLTSRAIDPAIAIGGIGLTAYGLKDKSAEELGHLTPHLAGGLLGGALGWRAASGAALKMEMSRGFNARYENPSSTLYQVDGPRNAIRPLNSDIVPLESNPRIAANPMTNELRVIESVRRGGQTVEPNVKFGDNINDVSALKPKDTTIRSEIKVYEEGSMKPKEFQFEMEAPKTESITIKSGRVKSQLELEVPRPETPLNRVTAKRRNLRVEETPSKRSIWQDETAQLMTQGEVKPSSQFARPLFQRGASEVVPEKTMLFNTKMRTPSSNTVPLFFAGQTNASVLDNALAKETDFLKDKIPASVQKSLKDDMKVSVQKRDMPAYTKSSLQTSVTTALQTPSNKPKVKDGTLGVPFRFGMPVPVVEVPTRRKSKKKGGLTQKKDAWEYKRTTNKYKSPLDAKVKGGLI